MEAELRLLQTPQLDNLPKPILDKFEALAKDLPKLDNASIEKSLAAPPTATKNAFYLYLLNKQATSARAELSAQPATNAQTSALISATNFTNPNLVNALRKTFYSLVPPDYLPIGTYTSSDAAATYTCSIALESPSLGHSFSSDISRPDVGITCVRSPSPVPSLPKFVVELGRLLVSPPDAPKDMTTKPLETGFVLAAEISTRQAWLFWDAKRAAAAVADDEAGADAQVPVPSTNNGNLPGFDAVTCAAVPLGVDINSLLPAPASATGPAKSKPFPVDAKKFVTLTATTGQSLTFGGVDAGAWGELRRVSPELEVAANFKVKAQSSLGSLPPAA